MKQNLETERNWIFFSFTSLRPCYFRKIKGKVNEKTRLSNVEKCMVGEQNQEKLRKSSFSLTEQSLRARDMGGAMEVLERVVGRKDFR